MLNTDKINGKETYHGLDMGAYAWAQLNLEANPFGILPKHPWDKSGWRLTPSNFRELTE